MVNIAAYVWEVKKKKQYFALYVVSTIHLFDAFFFFILIKLKGMLWCNSQWKYIFPFRKYVCLQEKCTCLFTVHYAPYTWMRVYFRNRTENNSLLLTNYQGWITHVRTFTIVKNLDFLDTVGRKFGYFII